MKPNNWYSPYPLPKDVAEFVNGHGHCCRNLGLWLDRYTAWIEQSVRGHAELQPSDEAKRRVVPMLVEVTDQKTGRKWCKLRDNTILDWYRERWKGLVRSYTPNSIFTAVLDYRFVVGLGAAHVLETSLSLHPIYGFPYIPASGLKGVTRAYADKSDEDFHRIFGSQAESQEQAGNITFFDAIPARAPWFKLDVMTPHYSEYYQGNKPPADWLSPNPVYFLTVENTPFCFAIATRCWSDPRASIFITKVQTWLKEAISTLGIGAKTSAGYGYFVPGKDANENMGTESPQSLGLATTAAPEERIRAIVQSWSPDELAKAHWQKLE
jgi:CRISPR-associated protein Cmr6